MLVGAVLQLPQALPGTLYHRPGYASQSRNLQPHHFGGGGTVYSYTVMYDAPSGYDGSVPYPAALVRLDEGPLVAAQLTDVDIDEVYVGMPVEMVTRRLREYGESGMIAYGYKFRPRLKDNL